MSAFEGPFKALGSGRFTPQSILGVGRTGKAVLAKDEQQKGFAVVKVPDGERRPWAEALFSAAWDAAEAAATKGCPRLLHLEEVQGAGLCLVRQHIHGIGLPARLERSLDLWTALHLLIQITRLTDDLHGRGLVHGGLDPSRIWVDARGEVSLLGVVVKEDQAPALRLPPGDFGFQSPETRQGLPPTASTDRFAVRQLAKELLSRAEGLHPQARVPHDSGWERKLLRRFGDLMDPQARQPFSLSAPFTAILIAESPLPEEDKELLLAFLDGEQEVPGTPIALNGAMGSPDPARAGCSFRDLLQEASKRPGFCQLTVDAGGGARGTLWMNGGHVVDCATEAKAGLEAFQELAGFTGEWKAWSVQDHPNLPLGLDLGPWEDLLERVSSEDSFPELWKASMTAFLRRDWNTCRGLLNRCQRLRPADVRVAQCLQQLHQKGGQV